MRSATPSGGGGGHAHGLGVTTQLLSGSTTPVGAAGSLSVRVEQLRLSGRASALQAAREQAVRYARTAGERSAGVAGATPRTAFSASGAPGEANSADALAGTPRRPIGAWMASE